MWKTHRPGRAFATLGLVTGLLAVLVAAPATLAGAGTGPPSVRLLAVARHQVVQRPKHSGFLLDPGVYVMPVGGTFALHVARPDYMVPPTISQVWTDGAGSHERVLPSKIADGWNGLGRFLLVRVRDAEGNIVRRRALTFCPNSFNPQRVQPGAVQQPTMPAMCGGINPFDVAQLWGIDRGWAVDPYSPGGFFFEGPAGIWLRLPNGHYTVTSAIAPPYVSLFGVDPARAVRVVRLTVKTGPSQCCFGPRRPPGQGEANGGSTRTIAGWDRTVAAAVPTTQPPDPQFLPDLGSLPAFQVFTSHRRNGHDYLSFGATEWVGGGSALDVEGFRRANRNTMRAYQYFFQDGQVVGRAPVGTMEFDTRRGHHHWHFEQFARYSLLTGDQSLAVRSHKQSFCIAPTDPVDTVLPGATLRPNFLYFGCGGQTALWIQETLPLGWGDTYFQYVAGQSFDITTVPNGTYYIAVTVNPEHLLYEQEMTNDTSLRLIVLAGRPGHRRVCVPAVGGVDQEGTC
jgi:hypothetical protein